MSTKTIRKIIQSFRRRGKIRRSLTWKKFLETQIQFIYAMDFFTVDTMLGKRFYVFAVISHKTREMSSSPSLSSDQGIRPAAADALK